MCVNQDDGTKKAASHLEEIFVQYFKVSWVNQ